MKTTDPGVTGRGQRGGRRAGAGRKPGTTPEKIALGHLGRAARDVGLGDLLPGIGQPADARRRHRMIDYAEDQLPIRDRQERKPERQAMRKLMHSEAPEDELASVVHRETQLATLAGVFERASAETVGVDIPQWPQTGPGWLSTDLATGAGLFREELREAVRERLRVELKLLTTEWLTALEREREASEWSRLIERAHAIEYDMRLLDGRAMHCAPVRWRALIEAWVLNVGPQTARDAFKDDRTGTEDAWRRLRVPFDNQNPRHVARTPSAVLAHELDHPAGPIPRSSPRRQRLAYVGPQSRIVSQRARAIRDCKAEQGQSRVSTRPLADLREASVCMDVRKIGSPQEGFPYYF